MPEIRPKFHQSGQASIELIAGLPVLLMAGGLALQLLLVGYSVSLADGASQAGAVAAASGVDPVQASRAALPTWAHDRAKVEIRGSRVEVRLEPPTAVPGLARWLEVRSSAWAVPEPSPSEGSRR